LFGRSLGNGASRPRVARPCFERSFRELYEEAQEMAVARRTRRMLKSVLTVRTLTGSAAALLLLIGLTGPVQAGFLQAQAKQVEPIAQQAADPCCPRPCIEYRQHLLCRHVCCDPCQQPIRSVVQVTDPCTCCPVNVPVCIPGCCTGAPCVTTRCGILGRTITEFKWCCGFRVKVIMDRRGDLVVHSYGR